MTHGTLTPTRIAAVGVACILVVAVAVLPGLALLAVLLLVAFAIVRVGGYRGRWLALAAAVLAFTLLTVGHRLDVRDEGGSSIVSQTARPG